MISATAGRGKVPHCWPVGGPRLRPLREVRILLFAETIGPGDGFPRRPDPGGNLQEVLLFSLSEGLAEQGLRPQARMHPSSDCRIAQRLRHSSVPALPLDDELKRVKTRHHANRSAVKNAPSPRLPNERRRCDPHDQGGALRTVPGRCDLRGSQLARPGGRPYCGAARANGQHMTTRQNRSMTPSGRPLP
jgi:hypothetical protein